MKARKKPVIIDAWRVADLVRDAAGNWAAVPAEVRDAYEAGGWVFMPSGIQVPTLEGPLFACLGDYLLRGVAGEFYPCKPEIFEMTYEILPDSPAGETA